MRSLSTSSARFPRISNHGVPTKCWCGEGITTFGSSTAENRYQRFYRCQIARDRKTENHLFKWIDESLIDEIRMVDAKHERVAQEITKFEERVMEKVKSEIVRVEADLSENLKEKVNLEIARVAQEMNRS
ncbi:uncharacterized protein At4g04775-like [Brassica napus]|nr:uncharacterized protein At4g04775-like [Brassica napus]